MNYIGDTITLKSRARCYSSVTRRLVVDTAVYPVETVEYTIADNNINFYFYLLMDRINMTIPHYIRTGVQQ